MQTEHIDRYINEKNIFESHGGKSKLIFSSSGWHPSRLKFDSLKDVYLLIWAFLGLLPPLNWVHQ